MRKNLIQDFIPCSSSRGFLQSFVSSVNSMVLLLGVMKLVLDLIGVLNGVFVFLIGVLNPEVETIVLDGVVKTLFPQLSKSTENKNFDSYSIIVNQKKWRRKMLQQTPSCKTYHLVPVSLTLFLHNYYHSTYNKIPRLFPCSSFPLVFS